jgi:hypothetical protein
MNSSTKIAYSRLLYADFIRDYSEEKEIIERLKEFGFSELNKGNDSLTKFGTEKMNDFIKELQAVCNSDSELLNYIKNIVFWIHSDGILSLKVVVVEVVLKTDDLQLMKKTDLESKIWKLSILLGRCFCEGPIPLSNSSKDFRILKFSTRAIPNVILRNFVAEFVVEAERGFFDDFNKNLDSLGEAVGTKEMITQKIREAVGDKGDILTNKIEKIAMKGDTPAVQKVKDARKEIIALEPISFLEGGFSYDQSIVRGYANEMFIIGKIVQGSLNNSTPLYFTKLSLGISEIPLANLESMPVLQFPGRYPLLDFSFGAGQILALQLLNSWNRNVEMLIREVTTKQTTAPMNIKTETEETLEELRDLLFHRSIDQKISVNYRRELLDLANPSAKTFLYELPIPPEDILYSSDPERHGLEKPGPIVSNLGALVLNNLELNEKHLSDLIALKRSKIDVLKIAEDRKNNRIMVSLTAIVALATIVNVILFIINRI